MSDDWPQVTDQGDVVVHLRTKGKIMNQNAASRADGLVSTIWNYPVRETLWKIKSAYFNQKTGEFALADERGQVYMFSTSQNFYRVVRKASVPVSACSFIHCHMHEIIVAYENGVILVIDSVNRDIVQNIQISSKPTASVV